jgi:hypothetical protein
VEEDREVRGAGTSGGLQGENKSSRSREVQSDSGPLDLGGHMAEIHVFQRKNPSRKFKERIPEELGAEAILVIH